MELSYYFTGWTKERALWFIGLIFITFLAIFVSLNVGVGNAEKVNGIVTSIGLDTATRYEITTHQVTIQADSGHVVTIEVQRDISINKGDKVILMKSKRLLTSGSEYNLHKVLP